MANTYTDAAWSTPESGMPAEQYCSLCLIDVNPQGVKKIKEKCYLPVRKQPGGAIYKAALRNAASRLPQVKDVPDTEKRAAAKKLVRLMRATKMVPGFATLRMAGMNK